VFIAINVYLVSNALKGLIWQLWSAFEAARDLFNLMDRVSSHLSFGQLGNGAAPLQLQGNVELSKVTFYFPQHVTPAGNVGGFMLRNCSFEVAAGGHLAIAGPSGSGKTTLLRLVAGLYTARAGHIKFDGHDCSTVDVGRLQPQIAYLDSKVSILNGATLLDNVRFVKTSTTPEALQQALLNAGIDSNVRSMLGAKGFEITVRGADGVEKAELVVSPELEMRIQLARAFLQDPKVVLVDDVFAMLDLETEERLRPHLDQLLMGRTALVVSHRRAVLEKADSVLLLEEGETVAVQDTYDRVLQEPQATFLSALHRGE